MKVVEHLCHFGFGCFQLDVRQHLKDVFEYLLQTWTVFAAKLWKDLRVNSMIQSLVEGDNWLFAFKGVADF